MVAATVVVAVAGTSTGGAARAQSADTETLQVCADLPDAAALLAELNARRALDADCGAGGRFGAAAPLHWDDRLARIAGAQADVVARRHELSHGSGGTDLGSRLRAVTHGPVHAAENLAAGPDTLAVALSRWMRSAPHCANVMAPSLLEAGVGCAMGGDADGVPIHYWALILGEPRHPVGDGQTVATER